MKKTVILFLLTLSFTLHARFDCELTFSSRFLDRGFDVFAENRPALQPALGFSFGKSGLSLNLFASFPLQNYSQLSELNEIDLTLDYSVELKGLTLSCGITNYGWYFCKQFSFKTGTSQEVYLGAELSTAFFSPRLFCYYDFGQGDGAYIEMGIARTIRPNGNLELSFDLWQGYNNGQWGVKKGFADLNLKVSIAISAGKISVVPFLWYCRIFNREINPQSSELTLGITLKTRTDSVN